MNQVRHIKETDLRKDEVELLGRLLQGQGKKNVAAGVRLVFRGWAEWAEPDCELALTKLGIEQARKLWPGLDENPATLPVPSMLHERGAEAVQQLELAVPPLVGDAEGLLHALALVIGPHGEGIATALLEHYPQGRGLATATTKAMMTVGVPEEAATRIHLAFMLARTCRRRHERWGRWIGSAEDMAESVFERFGLADLEVECLWVGALDSSDSLIEITQVSQGSLSHVTVSMRDVFTPLCRVRAASCFIAHNHPSGDLRFSNDDLRLTQRVLACGRNLEITLRDHIVLAPDGRFSSLRDEKGMAG